MIKYHDTNPLAAGRKHVSIGLEYPRLKTDVALDISCPDKLASSLPSHLIGFLEALADSDAGPAVKRIAGWAKASKAHLKLYPACACCGNKDLNNLIVHHIEPVWVNPARELDPENLITLCEASERLPGFNCHLSVGHLGNWRLWNPRVVEVCEHVAQATKKGKK